MKHLFTTFVVAAGLGLATAHSAPIDFDFKDPKGVNNIVFQLDAPLESINGTGDGITGTVSFDPDQPGTISGSIVLASNSLTVPNGTMQEHLAGAKWLDTAKYPKITFEAVSADDVKKDGDTATANLKGKLTLKGVTKEMTVPVKMTYLKGKLQERGGSKVNGDLLVLRSKFTIKRDDFGINPGQNEDKVSEEIDISLSVVGIAPY